MDSRPAPRARGRLVLHGVLCSVVCGIDPGPFRGLGGFTAPGNVPASVSNPLLRHAFLTSLPASHRSVYDDFYRVRHHAVLGDIREASQACSFGPAPVTITSR